MRAAGVQRKGQVVRDVLIGAAGDVAEVRVVAARAHRQAPVGRVERRRDALGRRVDESQPGPGSPPGGLLSCVDRAASHRRPHARPAV